MINIKDLRCRLDGCDIITIDQLHIKDPGLYIFSGPSGCGKTTLLNIISGLEKRYQGQVAVFNRDYHKMKEKDIVRLRASHFSIFFQHNVFLEDLTLEDNMQLCRVCNHKDHKNPFTQEVNHLCSQLKIAKVAAQKVKTLSGGEKTRGGIARALTKGVPLYIFDEPTAALDHENAARVMELIENKAKTSIVLLVTHDTDLAKRHANIIFHMAYGRIIKEEVINPLFKKDLISSRSIDYRENAPFIAHQLIKAKKRRHLVTGATINLGLVGIGLSLMLVDAVNTKLVQAFRGQFNEDTTYIQSTFSPQVNKIMSPSDHQINLDFGGNMEIGSIYLNNFDQFFPDTNELTVHVDRYRIPLPSFHVGLFNESLFFDEMHQELNPSITFLADDELALILPQDDFKIMQNIFGLPYKNNIDDLSNYISRNPVVLTVSVANKLWDYDDEFSYRLKSVMLGSKAAIVLQSPNQVRQLFEEKMPFPCSLDQLKNEEYPWVLKKLNYVFFMRPFDILWDAKIYHKYLPFTANNRFFTHITDAQYLKRRLLIYETPPKINHVVTSFESSISPTFFTFKGGLHFIPELLLLGFQNNFIVSSDPTLVEDFIRIDKSYVSVINPDIKLDPKIINFGLHHNSFGSFNYENTDGSYPLNWIGVSKGLAKQLFGSTDVIGKEIYVGALLNVYEGTEGYHKEYQTITLGVSEVVDHPGVAIYQHPLWAYLLFKDGLGVSPLALEITGALFVDGVAKDALLSGQTYAIHQPYHSFKAAIDETIMSLDRYTTVVAFASFLLSILIIFVVIYLLISETNDQFSGLYLMGYSKEAIQDVVTHYIVTFISSILILALVQLFILSFVIEFILMDFLNISFRYLFQYQPYLWVLMLTMVVLTGTLSYFKRQMQGLDLLQYSKRDL